MTRARSDDLTAYSVNGREFTLELPLAELELRVGDYVVVSDRLGQATSVALAGSESPPAVRVQGRILAGGGDPFSAAEARVASSIEVARWFEASQSGGKVLDVGALTAAEGIPLTLDAGAFTRNTFLCGQSGSGKTYALGTILERLLAETSLRIVVLDPNSDFVKLGDLRDGGDPPETYRAAVSKVDVRRAGDVGSERLHVRFRDFGAAERAAVLRLDPIADLNEYGALVEAVEGGMAQSATVVEAIERLHAQPDSLHSLAVRRGTSAFTAGEFGRGRIRGRWRSSCSPADPGVSSPISAHWRPVTSRPLQQKPCSPRSGVGERRASLF